MKYNRPPLNPSGKQLNLEKKKKKRKIHARDVDTRSLCNFSRPLTPLGCVAMETLAPLPPAQLERPFCPALQLQAGKFSGAVRA